MSGRDDGLSPATRGYVGGVICLAVAVVLLTLIHAAPLRPDGVLLAAALTSCMTLAWLFPVHFGYKTKLYVDTAVMVTAVLLFQPAVAILVTGTGTLVAQAIRRTSRDWVGAAFNSAQAMLVVAVESLLLAAVGWDPTHPSFGRPWVLLVLLIAVAAMHVLSSLSIAMVVAFQDRLPLIDTCRQALLENPLAEGLAQVSLVSFGVLAAMLSVVYPWALVLLVPPIIAIYMTLQHQDRLRQQAERARSASDESLADAQRIVQMGSWEWELETGRQVWSDEAYRLLGLPPRSILPTYDAFLLAVHPEDRAVVDRTLRQSAQDGTSFRIDHRIALPNGTERLVHQRGEVRPAVSRCGTRVVGTVQDITERKALEARVADITERQREAEVLAAVRRRLAEIRESERLRLARELHDGPVQDLLAISYQLADQPELWDNDGPESSTAVGRERARGGILHVVQQLRNLIGGLRPAGLAEFGLPIALEGYVAATRRQESVGSPEIVLNVDPALAELPQPLALTLFRVSQEAIRNALLHAGASRLTVDLTRPEGKLHLRVSDNGRGFWLPPRSVSFVRSGHFGLVGLAERVEHAGGNLTIDSAPGAGTTVWVSIPLDATGAEHDRAVPDSARG